MKMNLYRKSIPTLLAVAALLATSGCVTTDTGTLAPVWGPYSEKQPVPVINIEATIAGMGGDISLTTPEGVACTGKWSRTGGNNTVFPEQSITGGKGLDFYRAWSTYTGSSNLATATATCADGSTFSAEFLAVRGSPGVGIAADSRGNVYRVTF